MSRLIAPLSVFALAACVPLAVATDPSANGVTGETAKGATGTKPGAPTVNKPGAITSARPSFAPVVALQPSAAPVSPTPEPSPTPLPSPPIQLSAAHETVRSALANKLASVARIAFTQTQAGLLNNNSAGVVANNGAGVISNSAAGVVSNGGLGYRVAQAADAITVQPKTGEELIIDYTWADGSHLLGYYNPTTYTPEKPNVRRVVVNAAGHGVRETQRLVDEVWPDSKLPKTYTDTQVQAADDGRFLANSVANLTSGPSGTPVAVTIAPGTMRWDDSKSGLRIDVDAFALSFLDDAATYTYRFTKLDRVEKGTLSKLNRGVGSQVLIDLLHPEVMGDVEARVERADGSLVYTKSVKTVGGQQVFTYDMQGGLVLRFDKLEGIRLTGKLLINGVPEADAVLDRRNASQIFSVTFPEDATHPIVVGYGSVSTPTETPANDAAWSVSTVAGGTFPGSSNGTGTAASFRSLVGLVASKLHPGRFYASDEDAHNIRVIDIASDGTATVGTYAGTGVAGSLDGARASATFNAPLGLAVADDDTLYVADSGNQKIRKIAPNGTVSTYAGSGAVGVADGPGASATFMAPAGLAIAPDGTLYVSDPGAHTLRRVKPDRSVDTLAGEAGADGFDNGTGGLAHFSSPAGLAVTAQGNVLVADYNNHALRQVTPAGVVTTIAGGPTTVDAALLDGPASAACAYLARSVAIGPSGQPYIGSDTVRMLRTDGVLGSYAGTHTKAHIDGSHADAAFTNIQGIAFGPNNVLYVADGTRLRAVTPNQFAPQP